MKAVALISGGLDSILAARVIKEQGIDVTGVFFKIPFLHSPKKTEVKPEDLIRRLCEDSGIKSEGNCAWTVFPCDRNQIYHARTVPVICRTVGLPV